MWQVPREWDGEAAFVVCGGPSVAQLDLSKLKGRHTIVINSSYLAAPWADYLIFSDNRWWREHGKAAQRFFHGRIVTICAGLRNNTRGLFLLERQRTSGLSSDPTRLACWHTTVCPAINLAVHLGASCINLLGLDGRDIGDQMWHHLPHPETWRRNPNRYALHGEALLKVAEDLRPLGVRAFNANPDSTHFMFPHMSYSDMLAALPLWRNQ